MTVLVGDGVDSLRICSASASCQTWVTAAATISKSAANKIFILLSSSPPRRRQSSTGGLFFGLHSPRPGPLLPHFFLSPIPFVQGPARFLVFLRGALFIFAMPFSPPVLPASFRPASLFGFSIGSVIFVLFSSAQKVEDQPFRCQRSDAISAFYSADLI